MQRSVIAYIVIFVILIVVVIFSASLFNIKSPAPPAPIPKAPGATTNTIGSGTTTNSSSSTNNTNSTAPGPVYNYTGCITTKKIVNITNGDFSFGTYTAWNTTGAGWGNAPTNIIYANENGQYDSAPWANYSGDFFATTYQGGIIHQGGNLTSAPFEVVEPYINFRIISPANNQSYIEILSNQTPIMTVHYNTYAVPNNTNAQSKFEEASILLSPLLCKNVSIRAVEGSVPGRVATYDYIAVGDFYLSQTPVQTPGIIVNQTFSG